VTTGKFVREVDQFLQARDPLHKTMRRLATHLAKAKIPYAVVGGMAVYAQGYRRTSDDLDILMTREGLLMFRRLFVPRTYEPLSLRPRRLIDPVSGVAFDILVTGLFPGSGEPGPSVYPDPDTVSETIDRIRVVNLPTLIQLKLAARRHQDLADVVNLIRVHNLKEGFVAKLHPALHPDYLACLEAERREEEYEARHDQAFAKKMGSGKHESVKS
jgi:hypothetical protein